jgi:gluconokinase
VPEPPADRDPALFCYALTDERWVVGGAVSNGGIVERWAGTALAPDLVAAAGTGSADEAVLALATYVPPGSDGLVMLPYLLAERAPLWDPDLPGAYLGLRRGHTRAHLVRAAVEGVCLQLSTILDRLDRLQPVTAVRVTGGVFRSPLWRDVLAAVLDRPLHLVGTEEGTARGAAALGLLALGLAPDLEGALALLPDPAADDAAQVTADPSLVATYRGVRERLPALIASLAPVADLFPPSAPTVR